LKRIICIGNRFAYPDDFGMVIYDNLKKMDLDGFEVVEGGVGGMSLLPYFEDDTKVLIVDFGHKSLPKILTQKEIQKLDIDEYNHANSFLYMLKMLDKEYKIYLCQEEYDKKNIQKYINEILHVVKEI